MITGTLNLKKKEKQLNLNKMDNEVVGMFATLLKQDAEVVTESAKTEDGLKKLISDVGALKFFTTDEFDNLKSNIKKDEKDNNYNETKGTVLEMVEKNIKKAHSLDWKRGEDYNNVDELVAKLLNESTRAENGDEQLKTDLKTLQGRFNTLETDSETKVKELTDTHKKQISGIHLATELIKLKPSLDYEDDIIDGQLEMFGYVFNQKYTISFSEDNVLVVSDKDGVLKNEDVSPKSLADVVSEVSKNYLKYKEVVPKNGRGNGTPNNTLEKLDLKKYDTFEACLASNHGEGLQTGDAQTLVLYKEWQEAHN